VNSLVRLQFITKRKENPEYEKSKVIIESTFLGKDYSVRYLRVNLEDILDLGFFMMNHRMIRVLACLGMISTLLLTMASTGFVLNGYQKLYAAADFPTSDEQPYWLNFERNLQSYNAIQYVNVYCCL
jgi:hypothetical protein